MSIKKHAPTVCDLFAGCGGLTLGFLQAGFRVGWANEIDQAAGSTYELSHPGAIVHREPVEDFFRETAKGSQGYPRTGEVDLLVGGPPCQGFSGYNPRRKKNDPRNTLVDVFLDLVRHLEPKGVLIENVPGMLAFEGGKTPRAILKALSDFGYNTRLMILQAGFYGLPQNRWRVFIAATQKGAELPAPPQPTHRFPRTTIFGATEFRDHVIRPQLEGTLFDDLQPTVTVGDAIRDLPMLQNGGDPNGVREYSGPPASNYAKSLRKRRRSVHNNGCKRLDESNLKRCMALPHNRQVGWLDLPEHLKPANLLRHGDKRYDNRFGRLWWDGTFNTILTQAHPYWGRVFHPTADRVISIRECARAQGFPDSVVFQGGTSAQYMQVGNAVPPPLAKAIATEFLKVL
jgi:DNA (cytosine-5)-methyltransferase 1